MKDDMSAVGAGSAKFARRGSRRRKKRVLLLSILLFLVFLLAAELAYSNSVITVSRYTLHSNRLVSPIRVVFLSDLHGREFGKDNSRLLAKIAAQEPDLIALVGDFFNEDADSEEIRQMCAFIRDCSAVAPVYFGLGNHEAYFIRHHSDELLRRITEAGAAVLESSYLDLEIKGNQIRLGGYMGYYGNPHMMSSDREQILAERQFFVDFMDTDHFKLLLNHIPTPWLDWGAIQRHPVDLVLSGHYHGGILRIPLLEQGLFAPYVGWFPPYTKGLFAGQRAVCILTTGLAGVNGVPRFFNPPEIVCVTLEPA